MFPHPVQKLGDDCKTASGPSHGEMQIVISFIGHDISGSGRPVDDGSMLVNYGEASIWKKHTCAKMIEKQKIYLQKIHGRHELGSCMECNDTLHGSELGPHWVLGPKNSKFGPMGQKFLAQKFLYTKLFRYHGAIL